MEGQLNATVQASPKDTCLSPTSFSIACLHVSFFLSFLLLSPSRFPPPPSLLSRKGLLSGRITGKEVCVASLSLSLCLPPEQEKKGRSYVPSILCEQSLNPRGNNCGGGTGLAKSRIHPLGRCAMLFMPRLNPSGILPFYYSLPPQPYEYFWRET